MKVRDRQHREQWRPGPTLNGEPKAPVLIGNECEPVHKQAGRLDLKLQNELDAIRSQLDELRTSAEYLFRVVRRTASGDRAYSV